MEIMWIFVSNFWSSNYDNVYEFVRYLLTLVLIQGWNVIIFQNCLVVFAKLQCTKYDTFHYEFSDSQHSWLWPASLQLMFSRTIFFADFSARQLAISRKRSIKDERESGGQTTCCLEWWMAPAVGPRALPKCDAYHESGCMQACRCHLFSRCFYLRLFL